jgi:4-hydroxybenzoate polyprenyltransferase
MAPIDPVPTVADAPRGNWVDSYLPARFRPYAQLARWDRPIGWWLLLWPCWWSLALATGVKGDAVPNPWHFVLFLVGAIAMRGAGCTYNDIVDRDIDARVARTRSRPIPAGRVTVNEAIGFMLAQALVGFLVLIQFNLFAVATGIASLGVVTIYPFMKRVTGYPQLVLGLAFSWGALMGWAVTFGSLGPAAVALYLAAVAWTVGYDTIYAHQDREDDALIGLGSTARTFGERSGPFLAFCYLLAVLLAAIAFAFAEVGLFGWIGLAGFGLQLGWQVARFDMNDGGRCLALFRSNREAGLILFVGLVADAAIRSLG